MSIRLEKDNAIATVTLDMEGRSANVIGPALFDRFAEVIAELEADKDLEGVILTSAKKDFLAGADIDYIYGLTDPKEVMDGAESLKSLLRRLEQLPRPVVAALNGSALGGGYELALACHHRIVVNESRIKIGLPEVKLGLLPGGGGTQRLPRMIGVQNALPLILEGRELKPEAALRDGLVDDLASDVSDLMDKARAWIKANPRPKQPWDKRSFKWPGGSPRNPDIARLWAIAPSMANQKTRGNYPAAVNILSCVFEGSLVDFETACRIESRYFTNLVVGSTSKNMISAFWYQLNKIKKGESRPDGFRQGRVRKVGILGAGMMGSGIAYVSAVSGVGVVLKDVSLEAAEKGKSYSTRLLDKKVSRGSMTVEKRDQVLNRIMPTADAADLADCDLIIEAVFEDRDLKARVTQEAEAQIAETAVFASNTSTLPITGLAEQSSRPGNFIGLHFFSPVDKMPLVEIIVGEKTSQETLARAFDYVGQIRKTPIVVNDSRGFYTSRVFSTYVMEGIALLREGQVPREIESAGLQAGMPVGPLALSDEVSLSLMYHISEQTRKDMVARDMPFGDHPADEVITRMVTELDRPGKKAGRGFYDYPEGVGKTLWSGLAEQFPLTERPICQAEMIDRIMFIQALETVRCMEEKVVTSVADANIGSIFGWGFSPFKGGTLQYINDYGVEAFVKRARELATTYGPRFEPPAMLVEMAGQGKTF